ncbi:hypothetical protein HK102_010001, partial [Quaeritorhiza haematococci]
SKVTTMTLPVTKKKKKKRRKKTWRARTKEARRQRFVRVLMRRGRLHRRVPRRC